MEKASEQIKESTANLQALYDSYDFNVPEKGTTSNVVYVGQTLEFLIFDGKFKDYVRVENRPNESKYLKNTNIGDYIDVSIIDIDEVNYFIKGSIASLYEDKAHQNLKSIQEGESLIAHIKEMTPAGYNIDLQYQGVTLSGFMPNTLAGINKLYDPESIIGKNLEVMIESYSRDEGTYIVSRRKYLQSLISESIKNLQSGYVYLGNVTGTTEFGVFVEFNDCLTGMIHKTNLNSDFRDSINQISPGTEIEFYIKEIIRDKIILTQILRESLWDSIRIGQTLTGKVKEIKQFGALVFLDDETIGLVHISELEKSGRHFDKGENIKVKVISLDRSNRKIFLTVN